MKWFCVTMAAAVVLSSFSSTALAQRQRGGRGFGFGRGGDAALLQMEAVQKELDLTSEQKEKLVALRPDRGSFQNLSQEERQKRIEELAKKTAETVKSVLTEQQQKRLAELRLQREGASAITRPEVAKKLSLDDAQKEKIKKIDADNQPAERLDFQNATQEERQKYFAEARERREKTETALLAVLTPAQKENFEKMKGDKFEFPQRGRRNQNQNQ